MNLRGHVLLSGAAGAAVWAVTGEVNALPAALAAGVLPDLDHLPDYYLRYVRRNWKYLFLLLHGWEYAVVAVVVYAAWVREPWMLAVALGYLTQIGADQVVNRPKWHTYLFTARAFHGFRAQESLGRVDYDSYMSVVKSVPFGRARLIRWFESRLPPHEHMPRRRRGPGDAR